MPQLILASSSPYRRQLLQRLQLPFDWVAPEIDERPRPGESPGETARRLAGEKAAAVAASATDAWVIGSDQVASLDGQPVGKPGDEATARAQLQRASGRELVFHTAVALHHHRHNRQFDALEIYRVRLRRLSPGQIERYVRRDLPLDCAGAFRAEGLGIALFEEMRGDDPTALIGLPLIRLTALLQRAGIEVI